MDSKKPKKRITREEALIIEAFINVMENEELDRAPNGSKKY